LFHIASLSDMCYSRHIAFLLHIERKCIVGKTTLYHPISLMTIRGAADQCGFRFGRLTQQGLDPKEGSARYRAEVTAAPKGWFEKTQARQMAMVNACFNLDIWCVWAGLGTDGKYYVNLRTQLVNDGDSTMAAESNAGLEDQSDGA
jgi:hypothetical protein